MSVTTQQQKISTYEYSRTIAPKDELLQECLRQLKTDGDKEKEGRTMMEDQASAWDVPSTDRGKS